MPERYEAHYQHRTFYFYIVSKEQDELRITMYNTPYTFKRKGDTWQNSSSNQMNMVQELIDAVVYTAGL